MKVKFNDVSYTYSSKAKNAISDINIEFNKNEIIFILGHTGSGKSTFIQHINGLLFASKGEVRVNDYVVNDKLKKIKEVRKDVGFLFQYPEHQLFEVSVLKDTMFGPTNFGFSESESKEKAKNALKLLKLNEDYFEKSPFDLSGGEKRKVALAGILASNPKILVLDEPTSSLDYNSKKELFELLVKYKNEGNIIIVISHDVDLAYEYGDRIIIFKDGYIKYDGDKRYAFNDLELIKESGLEIPFILRIKKGLKIDNDIVNMKELVSAIKENYYE